MLEGVNTGIVTVAPIDLNSVVPDLFDVQHLERGLEQLERVGLGRGIVALLRRRAVRACASGTRAFIAQITEGILAMMAVLPIDLDAFGF